MIYLGEKVFIQFGIQCDEKTARRVNVKLSEGRYDGWPGMSNSFVDSCKWEGGNNAVLIDATGVEIPFETTDETLLDVYDECVQGWADVLAHLHIFYKISAEIFTDGMAEFHHVYGCIEIEHDLDNPYGPYGPLYWGQPWNGQYGPKPAEMKSGNWNKGY